MKINQDISQLIERAKEASKNSYSPYSKFKVGAALINDKGQIYSGCNVENLSFPAGICAEQTAICKAVSEAGPDLKINILVVFTPTDDLTTPCGLCRQVINEFATPATRIICVCNSNTQLDTTFDQLFPLSPTIKGLK
ncbi:cytidine deaminase [Reichenbachiella ulvae]|uniref:Cytidine deaminase n=1 Tax=Reichenbachiella ulvae TaxID=2980104 RepID=A0ABT3CQD9_9BACT|nr:cytidine deaminase [Reichenbachiella ulvae]MCV9385925.1 cytidine deaminase [Reichenbachiella ulvae]